MSITPITIAESEANYLTYHNSFFEVLRGIRATVVMCWTVGQQVDRSILRQGHASQQIHLIRPGCLALLCRIVA